MKKFAVLSIALLFVSQLRPADTQNREEQNRNENTVYVTRTIKYVWPLSMPEKVCGFLGTCGSFLYALKYGIKAFFGGILTLGHLSGNSYNQLIKNNPKTVERIVATMNRITLNNKDRSEKVLASIREANWDKLFSLQQGTIFVGSALFCSYFFYKIGYLLFRHFHHKEEVKIHHIHNNGENETSNCD